MQFLFIDTNTVKWWSEFIKTLKKDAPEKRTILGKYTRQIKFSNFRNIRLSLHIMNYLNLTKNMKTLRRQQHKKF